MSKREVDAFDILLPVVIPFVEQIMGQDSTLNKNNTAIAIMIVLATLNSFKRTFRKPTDLASLLRLIAQVFIAVLTLLAIILMGALGLLLILLVTSFHLLGPLKLPAMLGLVRAIWSKSAPRTLTIPLLVVYGLLYLLGMLARKMRHQGDRNNRRVNVQGAKKQGKHDQGTNGQRKHDPRKNHQTNDQSKNDQGILLSFNSVTKEIGNKTDACLALLDAQLSGEVLRATDNGSRPAIHSFAPGPSTRPTASAHTTQPNKPSLRRSSRLAT